MNKKINDLICPNDGSRLIKRSSKFYHFKDFKYPVISGIPCLYIDTNNNNKINFKKNLSLEAQISSISDDIAYNNHDIQDGIKAKLFEFNNLREINFFNEIYKSHKKKIKNIVLEI